MFFQTERLILREPQLDDFDRYWQMINDPVAKQYTGGVTKLTHHDRLELFKTEWLSEVKEKPLEFSVIEKEKNKYLGYCGFHYNEEMDCVAFLHGYCRDSWGKGYGYEAAKVVIEYGFTVLNLEYITAFADNRNIASVKILQKLRMSYIEQVVCSITGLVDKYVLTKENYLKLPIKKLINDCTGS